MGAFFTRTLLRSAVRSMKRSAADRGVFGLVRDKKSLPFQRKDRLPDSII